MFFFQLFTFFSIINWIIFSVTISVTVHLHFSVTIKVAVNLVIFQLFCYYSFSYS